MHAAHLLPGGVLLLAPLPRCVVFRLPGHSCGHQANARTHDWHSQLLSSVVGRGLRSFLVGQVTSSNSITLRREKPALLHTAYDPERAPAGDGHRGLIVAYMPPSDAAVTSARDGIVFDAHPSRRLEGGDCNRWCVEPVQCRQFDCHGCGFCNEIPNFQRSQPCNGDGSTNFKFCQSWCSAEKHHCGRCDCQLW